MSLGASLGGSFVRHASGLWMLGDNAKDSSGNGNDGAAVGGVTFGQSGPYSGNNAALFNGTTGYVDVPDAASLKVGTGPFTIGLWVKTNGALGASSNILGKTHYTAGLILFYSSGHNFQLDISPDNYTNFTSYTAGGPSIDDSAWHLITVSVDRINPFAFTVDGASVSATDGGSTNPTGARLNPDSTASLCLGSDATDADGGGSRWPGLQQGVFLTPYAMGQPEAARLYRHGIRGV